MSMEKRILIAFVLSAAIFVVWSMLFPPPPPVATEHGETAQDQQGLEEATSTPEPAAERSADGDSADDPEAEAEEVVEAAVAATTVETLTLENDDMAVRLTNRGAALESIVLKGFTDDARNPLELVQTVPLGNRSLPLQMVTPEGVDQRLYEMTVEGRTVVYRWADGAGSGVVKRITIPETGFDMDVTVTASGGAASWDLSVGTGMRDTTLSERENRFATWGNVSVVDGGDTETVKREKTDEVRRFDVGRVEYVGFEDTYFVKVWMPTSRLSTVEVRPLVYEETIEGQQPEPLTVLQVNLEGRDGVWEGLLFTAPKEYDLLQAKGGEMAEALDFGIFHPISVFFLKILRWIHTYVQNWGVAIILLTIALRIVLFPLMHTSTVSMRKMQKVQPKAKAIQEKYKKNKSDPQVRNKMNQEVMALYKEEGVNPMAGCLPILVQMPILFALYTLFAHAIELRHAPFMWWIQDLSAKDPIYVTPVLMTATMWLQQRLAPQAGDPQQQRIMRLMPLIFGVMFLGFPSGLVLYWLTNNVVSILQQEVTLHLIGERKLGGQKSKGRRK
jgi:YidC/Oxa1 family membrane protein insertase